MVFPAHAEIALRIQQALEDPECSIEPLSKVICAQPMLTARVVSIASSVVYIRRYFPEFCNHKKP